MSSAPNAVEPDFSHVPGPAPLVEVRNVTKEFPIKKGFFNRTVGQVQAVTNVSLSIHPGEILGLVGESGCGKSTLGRCILQLLRPTSGSVLFEGVDLTHLSDKDLRVYRRNMQMVFQNPYSSLDPRMSIGDTLAEPFIIHKLAKGSQLAKEIQNLADVVGLPKDAPTRFPHELSGGQRQRVCIARALALKPKFIVADEPVSALDVSVQAQILNLLKDLKDTYNLTYLFIAHNLNVIEYLCDRIAVMYLGEVVELGATDSVAEGSLHPYSQALTSAIAIPDPHYDHSNRILLQGDLPSPSNPPSGCRFHTRCRFKEGVCEQVEPALIEYRSAHWAHCHLVPKINNL